MRKLTTVETVHEEGSWLFTVRDRYGDLEEAILVPCDDGVEAWINRCTHESQRFDTGQGVPMREGQLVCPRHGSMFDACSGDCDNGEAADTTLPGLDVSLKDGAVYLNDGERSFVGPGGIGENEPDDEDGGPESTSHIGF